MQDMQFINGEYISSASGKKIDVIDPSNGRVYHQVSAGNAEDIDKAVKAARAAFDDGPWPKMSGRERAAILRKMGDIINERVNELAKLEVQNNGKPLPEAVWDIEDTAGCFHFYADLAEELDQDEGKNVPLSEPRFSSIAVREPVGVAGAIIPWNFPMLMAAWKVAPALAAGCSVVLKPSEVTPITALEYGVIAQQAGLPKGVLNIVTGLGPDAGQPLTDHPGVDKLAFTGSVPTGSKIMAAAARDIKAVSLELGGKSPLVIFEDTDIEAAVEWIMFGIFWNKGEVCSATSRVLIARSIYDNVLARLIEEAQKIKIGHGMEKDVLLGPIVNKSQFEKIKAAIARGVEEGATLASGGRTPDGFEEGYYLEPTIFTDVPLDSWIWKEEIFGPVVCVRPFDSEEDAIRQANDSKYGLAAAVMSADLERANRVARAFRAGIVWVNCSQPTFTEAPWGGYKQSGIGRELGEWGLNNYLETKQITTFNDTSPWGWFLKE
ncbi:MULTISPECIES: aldehyde dehydrogenase family protein [unclassified Thalassospira]|uniref:aldehyde dehydrogenase family protein n=1 Tax=unclassified Thalassospira TaxID=2648997 RepID=UPI000ECDDBA1|nr:MULTISPECIES: aldehyde dehydrogenase family protein [unclassified Thalassospira]HAI29792.1 aldehyde dehydrogenase [Thalassospira sp.]|tara:strand:- start:3719 stop:5197 length:1479 start_codon:yes stop_codon:yes gene_type:complete